MSVQSEITRLENAKAAIKAAIEGKGVTVPEATLLDGMASLIESIEAGGGFEVSTGVISPSEAVSSISWEHGLSKAPSFVLIFLPIGYSYTTFANHTRMYFKKYNSSGGIEQWAQPYVSKGSTSNLICFSTKATTDTPFIIDDTTVTAGACSFEQAGTVKNWCAGKPYNWICVAGDLIFPYK